jgi:DNA polymerase-3 subunit gamma/tau
MAKRKATPDGPAADAPPAEYTVVARRYRPQQFADLVGQEPVAQALVNAIKSGRIAHAYLFTGLRGVGKTSAARILAKALNCEKGPTPTPCDVCESCRAIAAGQDVDVLEIDGASNRGIDNIRELRQNVQFRPTHGRYKIYIIDEVHMVTPAAFNALLKTLEEPPPHVKFIFATTDASKVPITILSRCQRFDFAGIPSERILDRLRAVVAGEGMQADDEALELVAKRAGGSMRDAQSLLDQLLAFGGERLTAEQVHKLLGTAPDDLIAALAAAVLGKDPPQALRLFADGLDKGLQAGELLDQFIEYWRDLMLVGCGGAEVIGLSAPPRFREAVLRQAAGVSLDTVLAGLDILQSAKARLRGSGHGRVLVEMALVRLSRLDDLVSLSQLAQVLQGGEPLPDPTASASQPQYMNTTGTAPQFGKRTGEPTEGVKKKSPSMSEGGDGRARLPLTSDSLPQVWPEILTQVGPILGKELERAGLPAISGPNHLVIRFSPDYNRQREYCADPTRVQRLQDALKRVTGQDWAVRFETAFGSNGHAEPAPTRSPNLAVTQQLAALDNPLVQRAIEVLDAKLMQMDDGFGQAPEPMPDDAPLTDPEEP